MGYVRQAVPHIDVVAAKLSRQKRIDCADLHDRHVAGYMQQMQQAESLLLP